MNRDKQFRLRGEERAPTVGEGVDVKKGKSSRGCGMAGI